MTAVPANRKIVSGDHGRTGRSSLLCTSRDGTQDTQTTVEFANTSYNYTVVADEEEVTDSVSAGYRTYEYGNKGIEGHIEAVWDATINYFGAVPILDPRGHYTMKLWLNAIASEVATPAGPHLAVTNMRISNIAITCPAKGKLTIAFDFKSSGVFTLPSGSVATQEGNLTTTAGS